MINDKILTRYDKLMERAFDSTSAPNELQIAHKQVMNMEKKHEGIRRIWLTWKLDKEAKDQAELTAEQLHTSNKAEQNRTEESLRRGDMPSFIEEQRPPTFNEAIGLYRVLSESKDDDSFITKAFRTIPQWLTSKLEAKYDQGQQSLVQELKDLYMQNITELYDSLSQLPMKIAYDSNDVEITFEISFDLLQELHEHPKGGEALLKQIYDFVQEETG